MQNLGSMLDSMESAQARLRGLLRQTAAAAHPARQEEAAEAAGTEVGRGATAQATTYLQDAVEGQVRLPLTTRGSDQKHATVGRW